MLLRYRSRSVSDNGGTEAFKLYLKYYIQE